MPGELADEVAERRDEIVPLACELIRFDTTSRSDPHAPARAEAALQQALAARLARAGAEIDVWEPAPEDVDDHPLSVEGIGFAGRPQLAARFAGSGGGRSLLLNGHIDVVTARLEDGWTHDPFDAQVGDGRIVGRGSCDMKGGIASMVVAAEALARTGALRGDVVVCTNTDEECGGWGALACARHGVSRRLRDRARAVRPRGVAGLPGQRLLHRRGPRPRRARRAGAPALRAAAAPSTRSRRRTTCSPASTASGRLAQPAGAPPPAAGRARHPPHPAGRRLRLERHDPEPGDADARRAGAPAAGRRAAVDGDVQREVEAHLRRWCDADPWLAEHPPRSRWHTEVNPSETPLDTPSVRALLEANAALGLPQTLGGLGTWYDGATFALETQHARADVRPARTSTGRTPSASTCRWTTS